MSNQNPLQYKTRSGDLISAQGADGLQRFLYKSAAGELVGLPIATSAAVTKLVGAFMNSRSSTKIISGFIKSNNIDMSQVACNKFDCFNDFFTRKLCDGARPVSDDPNLLISPCDSKLTYYKISSDGEYVIKGKKYTFDSLVGNNNLSKHYLDGDLLVFRLCVDDYHRYGYTETGRVSKTKVIKGKFHTVQPIAYETKQVLSENQREYCLIRTDNFKTIMQMEVGAMLVGKIQNHNSNEHDAIRGNEKGMFLFGGSTIVVALQKDAAIIDEDIILNSAEGYETIVKYGEPIGKKF